MIKAEELMIGDWIYDENRNINHQVGPEDFYLGNTIYFKPIQITHEILEKIGFESVENIFGFKTYKVNNDFILEDRGKRNCLCRSCYKTQPSSTFWVCDIEYVHELQHALRLCGIDKTIEL